ncbi:hypothetical protein KIN20_021459 [Parelaphostrongylus tenuis]|uniref:Uncharacterized protein n=1 Tax=Parelaphostrongylus tenuis TaxID=148309 RepID=A0AAD5N589_PARTN|nr:hypothetical protein KIN20_021459 [Parelaphostrongylus tenuis]
MAKCGIIFKFVKSAAVLPRSDTFYWIQRPPPLTIANRKYRIVMTSPPTSPVNLHASKLSATNEAGVNAQTPIRKPGKKTNII